MRGHGPQIAELPEPARPLLQAQRTIGQGDTGLALAVLRQPPERAVASASVWEQLELLLQVRATADANRIINASTSDALSQFARLLWQFRISATDGDQALARADFARVLRLVVINTLPLPREMIYALAARVKPPARGPRPPPRS
jgi:hypothetical protein